MKTRRVLIIAKSADRLMQHIPKITALGIDSVQLYPIPAECELSKFLSDQMVSHIIISDCIQKGERHLLIGRIHKSAFTGPIILASGEDWIHQLI